MMFTMSLYHRGCSKICSTQLKQVESVAYPGPSLRELNRGGCELYIFADNAFL